MARRLRGIEEAGRWDDHEMDIGSRAMVSLRTRHGTGMCEGTEVGEWTAWAAGRERRREREVNKRRKRNNRNISKYQMLEPK